MWSFTLNLFFHHKIFFMPTTALYMSEGGVWDGTRLYPGLADWDGPAINQHWAFLWMWRPGQNQTAEGMDLLFRTAYVLLSFSYGAFLLRPGVPARDHSEHSQDWPHIPAGWSSSRKVWTDRCCCDRGRAWRTAALLPGSVWTCGTILQETYPITGTLNTSDSFSD